MKDGSAKTIAPSGLQSWLERADTSLVMRVSASDALRLIFHCACAVGRLRRSGENLRRRLRNVTGEASSLTCTVCLFIYKPPLHELWLYSLLAAGDQKLHSMKNNEKIFVLLVLSRDRESGHEVCSLAASAWTMHFSRAKLLSHVLPPVDKRKKLYYLETKLN
ncbi:hypothetical protein EVAR_14169_1 [Eumeta japonica]|uniref:Uncharacterized protein n=1 Tax=Eumeta variegata TaxID=151549 RepID=A0A4C1UFV2_EUMVA|nr:hypothetical protein EVAR_14169_1 [Eumeta japonica]